MRTLIDREVFQSKPKRGNAPTEWTIVFGPGTSFEPAFATGLIKMLKMQPVIAGLSFVGMARRTAESEEKANHSNSQDLSVYKLVVDAPPYVKWITLDSSIRSLHRTDNTALLQSSFAQSLEVNASGSNSPAVVTVETAAAFDAAISPKKTKKITTPPTIRASAAAREKRQRAMSGDGVMLSGDGVMRLIAREIVGDRKFPPAVGRQYRAVFVGKEAVDLLLAKVRH